MKTSYKIVSICVVSLLGGVAVAQMPPSQPNDRYLNALTDKEVRKAFCSIDDAARQPCAFLLGAHGSFGIVTYDGQMRDLRMLAPGVGAVTIYDIHGPSKGGYYARSKANPACWVRDDPVLGHGQICVW